MMEQETVSLDTIQEMRKQHKPDTGIKLPLRGVSIKRDGGLDVLVDKEGSQIPCCFAEPDVGLEPCNKVNVTGTYHNEFFKVYKITPSN